MKVRALGYLGFTSPKSAIWNEFGPEIFGFGLGEPDADGTVHLRTDDRHQRVSIHPGDTDGLAYIGWELGDRIEFVQALDDLRGNRIAVTVADGDLCKQRAVAGMASFSDPAGYRHEIFFGPRFTPNSFRPGRAHHGFVAGSEGLGHVVVVVPETTPELDGFATTILGLQPFAGAPSEMAAQGGPTALFYRCNRRTHCFAYIGLPGRRGVQHFCVEANSIDDVGLAYDLVQERQVPVTLSLGRHEMDTLVSFYLRTPSGFDMEFGAGGMLLDDSFVQLDPSSPELWGHKLLTKGWAPTVRDITAS